MAHRLPFEWSRRILYAMDRRPTITTRTKASASLMSYGWMLRGILPCWCYGTTTFLKYHGFGGRVSAEHARCCAQITLPLARLRVDTSMRLLYGHGGSRSVCHLLFRSLFREAEITQVELAAHYTGRLSILWLVRSSPVKRVVSRATAHCVAPAVD